MAYTLPELPYPKDALEPYIDAKTMEIHHDKHHAAYVTNLNKALEGTDLAQPAGRNADRATRQGARERSARRSATMAAATPTTRCSGRIMGKGKAVSRRATLAEAIKSDLGGFDAFQEAHLPTPATTRFGSGWAWLSVDKSGKLVVESTPNQDSPLMAASTAIRRSWASTFGSTPTT